MSRKEPNDGPPAGAVKPLAPPPPPLPHSAMVCDRCGTILRVDDGPEKPHSEEECRTAPRTGWQTGGTTPGYRDPALDADARLDAFAAGLKERLDINKKRYTTDTTDYTYGGGSENVLDFDDLITEIDAFIAEFRGKR